VPDAPVDKFEAIFPEGPHSALTGYLPKEQTNMCGQKLVIPTTLTAQNGAVIEQTTPVQIEGPCGAVKGAKAKATKLQKALRACKKKYKKHKKKRIACERSKRKKYGHHAKKAKKAHRASHHAHHHPRHR
jgi:hypothetical protein